MSPGKVYGERFAVVPESVLFAPISDRAMRLWSILARYADPEGHAHPGRRLLSEKLACSLTTLDRAITELKDAGLLAVVPRFTKEGDQTSNDYRLISGPPLTTVAATPSPLVGTKGNPSEVDAGTTYLPAAQEIVNQWWEEQDPKPSQKYIAIVRVVQRALAVGWPPELIREAMDNVPTISARWLEGYVNRHKRAAKPDKLAAVKRMLEADG